MTYLHNRDFLIEVAKGNIGGHSLVHKFGKNPSVANGSFEMVDLRSTSVAFLSAPTTVRVQAGGNAADTAAGAGAQAITVVGVDDSLVEVSEDIELAGASASSNTTASFWRVYRMYIADLRSGSYTAANTAAITLENSGGGTDLIVIAAGEGQSQHAAYTVATGQTAYWMGVHIMVDSNKPADVKMMKRETFNDVTTPFAPKRIVNYWDGIVGQMSFQPRSPVKFNALTDIWFEASGSGAITEVSIDFELLLVDD